MKMQFHSNASCQPLGNLCIYCSIKNKPLSGGWDDEMPENRFYQPEGSRPPVNWSLPALRHAMEAGDILESPVLRCDTQRSLHVRLGRIHGIIPKEEAIAPWISGADREIALLTRVGKPACFQIRALNTDEKGETTALLSRRAAQEEAMVWLLEHAVPGTVLSARITHMEPFGAFADIGCGIIAMLPCERISVARISHPRQRFQTGQKILSVVAGVDPEARRFTLTHKELLGTWLENASYFQPGETVPGTVRSIKPYGVFIELTPNLSGLADLGPAVQEGDRVSVYIKSMRPDRMKIKLQIIEPLPPEPELPPLHYQITDGTLTRWVYSPPNYEKAPVETVFQQGG